MDRTLIALQKVEGTSPQTYASVPGFTSTEGRGIKSAFEIFINVYVN